MIEQILANITYNKKGIEIGGPSSTGGLLYKLCEHMDNVIFSKNTVWSQHTDEYVYHQGKTGKVIINDAVNITNISDESYDFCFASHCLEHIANPIKAVKEWLRIVKQNGYVVLILPEKTQCFDHKRKYSLISTLVSQYEKNVGEDDLSTLPEILANHDLSMDLPAGNLQQFTQRSLDNYNNRCLHHYVYNPDLLKEITQYVGAEFVHTVTYGLDIWFIMKKI